MPSKQATQPDNRKIKTNVFLAVTFAASTLFIIMMSASSWFTWLDEDYVESLELSPDADSLGIPLFGSLLGGIFFIFLSLYFYWWLYTYLRKWKVSRVDIFGFLPSRSSLALNVFKAVVYAVLAFMVIYLFYDYEFVNQPVLLLEIAYHLLLVIASLGSLAMISEFVRARNTNN